ncbi:Voltage-gated Ion Channel (VIC) Superfamily [Thraustotheca clavata]|uniref:Voltage-gated Ion Channel (VIC) Superfamily n=1 Tax=Thraustotheca clavata TaxID=74557 RepID=A0A1V9YY61_9STRA|nr:Voltage-gated Ion Channel (VIC) Superfamily [Thraustotheca clavata]
MESGADVAVPSAYKSIDVDLDMWQRKKRVYAQQLTDRLAEDPAFKKSFQTTTAHVQAIHKLTIDYERRRTTENRMFGISVLSIVLVLIECTVEADWIRIANTILTVLLLGLLLHRYGIEREIAIGKGVVPANVHFWELPPSFLLSCFVEFIVCSIYLPPGFYGSFEINQWIMVPINAPNTTSAQRCPYGGELLDGGCYLKYYYKFQILGLFVLLRMYMVPRFIRNLSDFYSYRIAFIGSLNNVDALGVLFSIKYFLRSRPFHFLIVAFLATLLTVSYALWILEEPVNINVSTYSNAVWLTVVTMATVGYGDRVPMTIPGQVLVVLCAMATGILLVGILSASFFALLDLNDRDRNVFNLLSNEKESKSTSTASARLIQAAWNLYQCQKRSDTPQAVRNAASVLLYSTAQDCRKLRKSKKLHVPTLHDELSERFNSVETKLLKEHLARKNRLLAMEKDLDTSLLLAKSHLPATPSKK